MYFKLLAAAALSAPLMVGAAQASTVDNIAPFLVFGDSLSDPGNTPFGQFTNGDVFSVQLGADLASGRNFAVGGATAADNPGQSDFDDQIAAFRASAPATTERTSAVVFFGGNDLLSPTSFDPITAAVTSISAGIRDLAANDGLFDFIVPGLPNLGAIPAAIGNEAAFLGASLAFNASLQAEIANLNADPLGISVTFVDLFSVFDTVLADPAAFGITQPLTETCLQGAISCDGFAFFDAIHPTEGIQALIADAVAPNLAPVPLPAGAWLLLGGLGGMVILRRRGQRAHAA